MVTETQRALAVWAVLLVPFALLAAYLWTRDDLSLRFVAAYWFAPAVLTGVGAIPPPWRTVTG